MWPAALTYVLSTDRQRNTPDRRTSRVVSKRAADAIDQRAFQQRLRATIHEMRCRGCRAARRNETREQDCVVDREAARTSDRGGGANGSRRGR